MYKEITEKEMDILSKSMREDEKNLVCIAFNTIMYNFNDENITIRNSYIIGQNIQRLLQFWSNMPSSMKDTLNHINKTLMR